MMLTDSHLHFDVFQKEGLVNDLVHRAENANVQRMIAIGGSPEANALALQLAQTYPNRIWPTIGHDRELASAPPPFDDLATLARKNPVVALGEMGLDYYYEKDTAMQQRSLFGLQLELARELKLPVVVHSREADDDTVAMLAEHARLWKGASDRIGVVHCFTGSSEFACRLLPLGLMFGLSGIITFKNAESLRKTAAEIPDDRILIETDAPYLAPVPHRGKQNEPAYVLHVAEALALIRKTSTSRIADITSQNAEKLFGLNVKQ